MSKPLLGVGHPVDVVRKGKWVKLFPGGEGKNNCPKFWYVRDGFGCIYHCSYCYLQRFHFAHELGAELNPDFDTLYQEVGDWLRRPGHLGLILGEVTDAWGWAHDERVLVRNLKLIEMFRGQTRHTLIFLTKSHQVHRRVNVEPCPQVVMSWSVNCGAVAEAFEAGADQADMRLEDAKEMQRRGWRVRLRVDPMIPLGDWENAYSSLAIHIASHVRPELVTLGTWRPRAVDPLFSTIPVEIGMLLEAAPDRRFRLSNRYDMYELMFSWLHNWVPALSLCKEDLHIQNQLYAQFKVTSQACNCLSEPVAVVGGGTGEVLHV